MMKQINLDDIAAFGKTVESVVFAGEAMFITFTDCTFACLRAYEGRYEGDGARIDNCKFDIYDGGASEAVSVGILTTEELFALREEKAAAAHAQQQEYEKAQYLKLKAKFEKEDAS